MSEGLKRIFSDDFLRQCLCNAGLNERDPSDFMPEGKGIKEAWTFGIQIIHELRHELKAEYRKAIEERCLDPKFQLPNYLAFMCVMEGIAHGYVSLVERNKLEALKSMRNPKKRSTWYKITGKECENLIQKISQTEKNGSHYFGDIPIQTTQTAKSALRELNVALENAQKKYHGMINKSHKVHGKVHSFDWLITNLLTIWVKLLGNEIRGFSLLTKTGGPLCIFLETSLAPLNLSKTRKALDACVRKIKKYQNFCTR